jgi:hypothetical protein
MTERRTTLNVDAAQALLEEGERRQRLRQMPKAQQAKARKDAARSRAIYDLPERVKNAVTYVAQQESMSASAVVALLLADGIARYREGRLSFDHNDVKRVSPSPRFDYTVTLDIILAVLRGSRSLER